MTSHLFEPVLLGALALANRVVMAPMTRSRAGPGDVPTQLQVDYYAQRASAGLIVTEGAQPSVNGKGYCRTPGIHTAEQVEGWRAVTGAVHAAGGRIVVQLMHCGRIGSRLNKADDAETVAPSAIRAVGRIYTDQAGMVDNDVPRELARHEIPAVIEEYCAATRAALAAGFDGVELHGTSGYLPAQFMASGSNQRTDDYGGSARNRVRFVVELLEAIGSVAGWDRTGLRLCPGNTFNDLHDADPMQTFEALLDALAPRPLAYLHLIRSPRRELDVFGSARARFAGPLVLNDGFDAGTAAQAIASGSATAVSFGRAYIANPDLVRRLRDGIALASFDPGSLYTPGPGGYTDYPHAD
jgi:N-ethylmaleimide reductase